MGLAVVGLLFEYLAMLRKEGPQHYVYQELADVGAMKVGPFLLTHLPDPGNPSIYLPYNIPLCNLEGDYNIPPSSFRFVHTRQPESPSRGL